MNRLAPDRRAQIVGLLAEGNSLRAASRLADVSINTVTKLLVDLGAACEEYQDKTLRKLKCRRIQCDEIWSFVYAKAKHLPEKYKGAVGYGDVWTWTALDAETKLVPSWAVGRRDGFTAQAFIRDLAARLASRVQLTTDGHKVYLEAVEGAFGSNIDYAMLVKMYEGDSGKRAVLQLLDRPNLDHPDSRRWESRGDRAGLVHVLGLDDEESTQLLLCLDKGADGSGDLAGADTDRPGRPGPLQSVRGDVVAVPAPPLRRHTRPDSRATPDECDHRTRRRGARVAGSGRGRAARNTPTGQSAAPRRSARPHHGLAARRCWPVRLRREDGLDGDHASVGASWTAAAGAPLIFGRGGGPRPPPPPGGNASGTRGAPPPGSRRAIRAAPTPPWGA